MRSCQLYRSGSRGEVQRRSTPAGAISKQGNMLLRFLLVEAAQVTIRSQPESRNRFLHLATRAGTEAKVAMAPMLAVHLYWMWRQGCDYGQLQKLGSHAGKPGNPQGIESVTNVMIGHPFPLFVREFEETNLDRSE